MRSQIVDRAEIHLSGSTGRTAERVDSFTRDDPKSDSGPISPEKPKRTANGRLILCICVGAIVIVAGGTFWISPYNHLRLADAERLALLARDEAINALPSDRSDPPVAPAAALARTPAPSHAPLPYHSPVTIDPSPADSGDDMALFLKLGGQAPQASYQTPPTLAAVIKPPQQALSLPTASVSSVSTATPKIAPPVAMVPLRDAGKALAAQTSVIPADPVARAALLRPAPMTDDQQLQVLQLVTQLGTLIRDERIELAELKADQESETGRINATLTDYGRRLSLVEAKGALNAATTAGSYSLPDGSGSVKPSPSLVSMHAQVTTPQSDPAMTTVLKARYHVQAASPGMAMLSELDPSGDEERQIPVSPGTNLPGYGKVLSIGQIGAAWVVTAEHGSIR